MYRVLVFLKKKIPVQNPFQALSPDPCGTPPEPSTFAYRVSYSVGESVSYSCLEGHVRQSGSEQLTCNEGTWEGELLQCRRKSCCVMSCSWVQLCFIVWYQLFKSTHGTLALSFLDKRITKYDWIWENKSLWAWCHFLSGVSSEPHRHTKNSKKKGH